MRYLIYIFTYRSVVIIIILQTTVFSPYFVITYRFWHPKWNCMVSMGRGEFGAADRCGSTTSHNLRPQWTSDKCFGMNVLRVQRSCGETGVVTSWQLFHYFNTNWIYNGYHRKVLISPTATYMPWFCVAFQFIVSMVGMVNGLCALFLGYYWKGPCSRGNGGVQKIPGHQVEIYLVWFHLGKYIC